MWLSQRPTSHRWTIQQLVVENQNENERIRLLSYHHQRNPKSILRALYVNQIHASFSPFAMCVSKIPNLNRQKKFVNSQNELNLLWKESRNGNILFQIGTESRQSDVQNIFLAISILSLLILCQFRHLSYFLFPNLWNMRKKNNTVIMKVIFELAMYQAHKAKKCAPRRCMASWTIAFVIPK